MTPPIFFHEKAIGCCNNEDFLSDSHLEYIYAMLVSWGMHRAGGKGAKMPPFEIFRESILKCRACIDELQKHRIEEMPSLIEYASYIFFYPTTIIGPYIEFKDYMNWIEYKDCYRNLKNNLGYVLRQGCEKLFLGMH